MDEEYKIIHSPLERRITERGVSVEVMIYRGEGDAGWILEVVDHTGGSTVWDDAFASDQAALECVEFGGRPAHRFHAVPGEGRLGFRLA